VIWITEGSDAATVGDLPTEGIGVFKQDPDQKKHRTSGMKQPNWSKK
jgi:hypothetical protein